MKRDAERYALINIGKYKDSKKIEGIKMELINILDNKSVRVFIK